MEDVISSYYTEQDPIFATEMEVIRRDRKQAQANTPKGQELDPAMVESYRWRELKAMFRSLCRQGTFVRQESPKAEWKPGATA